MHRENENTYSKEVEIKWGKLYVLNFSTFEMKLELGISNVE